MPSLARVSRINVLTAIRDHDLAGAVPFLEGLGFEEQGDDVLVVRGKRYDARALLAYAYGKATGDRLDPDSVTLSSFKVLTDLGFTVASRAELDRSKSAARTSTAGTARRSPAKVATRAPARPEPVVKLCPTCFTQLSVTGTCDYCE